MSNKIMSIDSLYKFFVEQNKSVNFSSKDSGDPIVVSIPGNFEELKNDMTGMLKLKLKVCHTELNRNGSFISKENMEKAMPSLKYRPLLAYIHSLPDGTEDFYSHNIEIIEDENGEEKINYIEKQVGCFTAEEPYLEYDEEMDKTYVIAYAVVPEEYTSAADIIRRKNGTKVSCELVINELSYNAKEKYLDLTDFVFGGCALLGCDEEGNEIGEGMLGARADITDFCHKEPIFDYQNKLVETLEKLNTTLSSFHNHFTEEGGENEMTKFEELLEQYGFTADELDFEYEEMTDEELEAAFEDYTCRKKKCAEENNDTSTSEDGDEPVATEENVCGGKKKKCEEEDLNGDSNNDEEPKATEQEACGGKKKKCSVDENGDMTVSFEISHDDIRCALYNLIGEYEESDNEWYGIYSVYDNYFVMQGWYHGKFYKQGYSVDGDNVTLEGERTELFQMLLTESEKMTVDKLRGDYAELESKYNELKTFKDNYDATELKAKKDAIFARTEYSVLAEDEFFKALIAESEKYSVEECETKADVIFAKYCKTLSDFAHTESKKTPKVIGVSFNKKETSKKPYGNLFNK